VSPLELKFRSLLDQVLVRPRTKEFLVGHPALIVALALWAMARGRAWIVPLLFVGAIGQESLVNSFCHLHTPIALTLARTWNSLWLGSLIGLAVVLLVVSPRHRDALTDEPQRHKGHKGHKEDRKERMILR
jgi:ABC-type nitrate/sulfonate/bicarbonate transport system permease component